MMDTYRDEQIDRFISNEMEPGRTQSLLPGTGNG